MFSKGFTDEEIEFIQNGLVLYIEYLQEVADSLSTVDEITSAKSFRNLTVHDENVINAKCAYYEMREKVITLAEFINKETSK
jgi:hypothetical protein